MTGNKQIHKPQCSSDVSNIPQAKQELLLKPEGFRNSSFRDYKLEKPVKWSSLYMLSLSATSRDFCLKLTPSSNLLWHKENIIKALKFIQTLSIWVTFRLNCSPSKLFQSTHKVTLITCGGTALTSIFCTLCALSLIHSLLQAALSIFRVALALGDCSQVKGTLVVCGEKCDRFSCDIWHLRPRWRGYELYVFRGCWSEEWGVSRSTKYVDLCIHVCIFMSVCVNRGKRLPLQFSGWQAVSWLMSSCWASLFMSPVTHLLSQSTNTWTPAPLRSLAQQHRHTSTCGLDRTHFHPTK